MAQKDTHIVHLPLDPKMVEKINDWRFEEHIGKMTVALRTLISKGLDAAIAEQPVQK
ncbi:hypothetical protein [Thalassospira lohafexi]|uniref:hypothetical protein n=1 Tax=Thalassospira lohafexi TaxID=744227 RepID=UPI0013FD6087|nr:hypothetical protein [Thalassospira lohafexi]